MSCILWTVGALVIGVPLWGVLAVACHYWRKPPPK
jgi:hypothetical protein